MNHITKPMLAGKCERPDALSFPVLATPKLDGIRCLKIDGRALTRSFKPVSNRFTRGWIEANLPDGLDGELIVRGTTFSETAGHIGRESGEPDFTLRRVRLRERRRGRALCLPDAGTRAPARVRARRENPARGDPRCRAARGLRGSSASPRATRA